MSRSARYAYKPDTYDSQRAIVWTDSPDSRSASRTTLRSLRLCSADPRRELPSTGRLAGVPVDDPGVGAGDEFAVLDHGIVGVEPAAVDDGDR
jgi:hypothetical protein